MNLKNLKKSWKYPKNSNSNLIDTSGKGLICNALEQETSRKTLEPPFPGPNEPKLIV